MKWLRRALCWLHGHEQIVVHETLNARTTKCQTCGRYEHEQTGATW